MSSKDISFYKEWPEVIDPLYGKEPDINILGIESPNKKRQKEDDDHSEPTAKDM